MNSRKEVTAKTLRVLLVDDNRSDAEQLREYAECDSARHVETIIVSTTTDAVTFLAKDDFDLIALDVDLSKTVGITGFDTIRSISPNTPVVVIYADGSEGLAQACMEKGAQDCLNRQWINRSLAQCLWNAYIRPTITTNSDVTQKSLDGLVKENPDGILVLAEDYTIQYTNVAADVLFEHRLLQGEPFGFPVLKESPVELSVLRRDGTVIAVEMRIGEIVWNRRKATMVTLRDVTSRKRAEEALRKREALLNDVGEIARVGGWELDVETNEVSWTRETYRIHEIPRGEKIVLSRAISFFDPPDRSIFEAAVRRCIEMGEPYDLELQFTSAKGGQLWTHTKGRAEKVNKRVVRIVGILRDITERKTAELAARESESKFRNLFQTSYDLMFITDLQGKIIDVNNTALESLGYREAELSDKRIHDFCVDREGNQVSVDAIVMGRDKEIRLKKKSGEIIEALITVNTTNDKDGNSTGFFLAAKDITE